MYKIYQERKQNWAVRPKKCNSKYSIEAEIYGKRIKNVQVWKSLDQNMIKKKTNKIQEQCQKSNSKYVVTAEKCGK